MLGGGGKAQVSGRVRTEEGEEQKEEEDPLVTCPACEF